MRPPEVLPRGRVVRPTADRSGGEDDDLRCFEAEPARSSRGWHACKLRSAGWVREVETLLRMLARRV